MLDRFGVTLLRLKERGEEREVIGVRAGGRRAFLARLDPGGAVAALDLEARERHRETRLPHVRPEAVLQHALGFVGTPCVEEQSEKRLPRTGVRGIVLERRAEALLSLGRPSARQQIGAGPEVVFGRVPSRGLACTLLDFGSRCRCAVRRFRRLLRLRAFSRARTLGGRRRERGRKNQRRHDRGIACFVV
jgi:hypothetical protein